MEYILFDLDGTLTDPAEGITGGVNYALEYFGIHTEDRAELYKYIGPPLRQSFMEFAGLSEEQSHIGMIKYREYFGPRGIFENRVYDGIPELLSRLKKAGKRVVLATSKPWIYAEIILEEFDLKKYFDFVSGSELNGARTSKAAVIAYALERYGIPKDKALMIGDREHDIAGAKQNGIKAMGVLYGFGSEEELKKAGADFIVENVGNVFDLIMKM